MIQEEKQLLIQVLCTLLPYGVQGMSSEGVVSPLLTRGEADWDILTSLNYRIVKHGWKPFLRPMSSMTEDEFKELKNDTGLNYYQLELVFWADGSATLEFYLEEVPQYCVINVFNWLNKKHFDYNGLITMNLALEAPKDMYNTKIE